MARRYAYTYPEAGGMVARARRDEPTRLGQKLPELLTPVSLGSSMHQRALNCLFYLLIHLENFKSINVLQIKLRRQFPFTLQRYLCLRKFNPPAQNFNI